MQSPPHSPTGNKPHDQLGHVLFNDPKRARAFLQKRFTKAQTNLLDFNALTVQNSTFVDDDLSKSLADLVYAVPLKDRSRQLELVLLQENKSSLSTAWPLQLQLLKYYSAITDQYRKTLMKAISEAKKPLPNKVLPMLLVFYHGRQPFNLQALDDWLQLDGQYACFRGKQPQVEFMLCDLASLTNEQLEADYQTHPDLLTGLLLMKNIWNPNLKSIINTVFKYADRLLGSMDGRHFFDLLSVYLGKGIKDKRKLHTILQSLKNKHVKDTAMSALDTMIKEGYAQGEAQGEAKKAREVVIAMLKLGKLSSEEIAHIAGVPKQTVLELKAKYIG